MQIKLQQQPGVKDTIVTITYDKITESIKKIARQLKEYEIVIEAVADGKIYYLAVNEIYYIESVDGKTFVNTKDKVYDCKFTLNELEKTLIATSIFRSRKDLLMNISYLKCVKPYPNHRLLAELTNGDLVIVSRKYIPLLKDKIRRNFNV